MGTGQGAWAGLGAVGDGREGACRAARSQEGAERPWGWHCPARLGLRCHQTARPSGPSAVGLLCSRACPASLGHVSFLLLHDGETHTWLPMKFGNRTSVP